jgi:hypothetical protein
MNLHIISKTHGVLIYSIIINRTKCEIDIFQAV